MSALLDEIREQPGVAARLIERGWPVAERVAALVRERDVDAVMIAARGSSDHAAIFGQYLLGIRNRLPVALAAPSIVTLYGAAPRFGRTLVLGISQSGRSPDVVGVVAAARDQGAPTVAITNDPSSDLAAVAEVVLDVDAGPERSIAATKTYTAELVALALVSTALLEGRERAARRAELDRIPAALEGALAVTSEARVAARTRAASDRAIVLGRGLDYATGREWALKLKELCRVMADAYSAADFAHGPLALADPALPVLAVALSGPTWPDVSALLRRLGSEFGSRVLVVSDRPDAAELGEWLAVPPGLPDELRPIASIVPCQLFALELALARGLDPERPLHIQKVTLTR